MGLLKNENSLKEEILIRLAKETSIFSRQVKEIEVTTKGTSITTTGLDDGQYFLVGGPDENAPYSEGVISSGFFFEQNKSTLKDNLSFGAGEYTRKVFAHSMEIVSCVDYHKFVSTIKEDKSVLENTRIFIIEGDIINETSRMMTEENVQDKGYATVTFQVVYVTKGKEIVKEGDKIVTKDEEMNNFEDFLSKYGKAGLGFLIHGIVNKSYEEDQNSKSFPVLFNRMTMNEWNGNYYVLGYSYMTKVGISMVELFNKESRYTKNYQVELEELDNK